MNTISSKRTTWIRIAAAMMIVMLLLAAMPAAQAQARPLAAIATRGSATTATELNTTSLTITKPTGVVSGDLMIANLVQVDSLVAPIPPAGWTLLDGRSLAGVTNRYAAVFYKVAGGSEPASYTFTTDATGSTVRVSGAILAFSGVDTANPFDVAAGTITVGTSTPATDASITTVTANAVILMLGQAAASAPAWSGWTTATSPGALTKILDFQSSGSTTLGAAWAVKATAGATGAGSATLSGGGERNGGYLLALRPTPTITPTTTTLSALSPVTYGTAVQFTATVSPTPTNGVTVNFFDGVTLIGSGTTAAGVATYTTTATQLSHTASPHSITATFVGNGSFGTSTSSAGSQVVNAKALTVTGVTASDKVYDGLTTATVNAVGATLIGNLDGANVTLNTGSAAGTFADKNVAPGKTVTVSGLNISGPASGNYTLTQPTTTADITAKELTVLGVLASDKVYDGTTTAAVDANGANLSGLVEFEDVNLDNASPAGAFADKNVGTNKPVQISGLFLTGADIGNYTLTQPTVLADITPAPITVTGVTASDKVYDGTTTATVDASAAAPVGVVDSEDVTLSTGSAAGTFADKNVGPGKTVQISGLALTGADIANYTLTQPTTTADITALALTVSGVTASDKVYDASTTATVDATSAALVGNLDDGNVVLDTSGVAGVFTPNGNVGPGKTVQISGLTISGSASGNYTLTQPTTTANITAKVLTVTGITASNKVYDGTIAATVDATSAALVGNLDGVNVVLDTSGVSGIFSPDGNVGFGKTVLIGGLTLTGSANGNYILTLPSTTADITAAPITVTADAKSKPFGTSDPALTYQVAPALFGSDTFSGALSRVAGEAIGSYAIQQGTLTAGSNYTITYVGANLTITAPVDPNTDVTIGGTLRGQYTLQPGGQQRVNYAGLDSGPVIVDNTLNLNIIAAIRDAWTPTGGSSITSFAQMMGLPATQLSDTYYFPAYNNVNLDEQLRFGNVGGAPTTVTVTIGGVVQGTYPLAVNEQKRVNYPGLDSGPVVVSASGGVNIIAAIRDAWTPAGGSSITSFSQMMGLPATQLSDIYYFPAYNNVNLDEQLRFGNVGVAPTTVTVTIGGVVQGTYPLAVNEQKRVNYAGLDSGPVVVSASGGVKIIAAIRDAWTPTGGSSITSFSQMMGLPATQLSDTYYFPAYNNVNLDEQLRFGNVGVAPTTVTVTIGGVVQGTYPLAVNEQKRVNYAGLDSGPVVVSASGGVKIIAALRDAWTPAGGSSITSFIQMMGLPAGLLSDTYYFPAYNNVTLNEQLRFGMP